jgi:NADH:ubiquinone oxidoreductase subunit 2 (subunit N)
VLSIFIRAFLFIFNPLFISYEYAPYFLFLFISCSLLSIAIGSIGALYQIKIKRLLAYSAVAT